MKENSSYLAFGAMKTSLHVSFAHVARVHEAFSTLVMQLYQHGHG